MARAIGAAIQRSQASIKELGERYDLNPKTVAKWKKRDFVDDAPMGPLRGGTGRHSLVLSFPRGRLFRSRTFAAE
ncbi:MAG: hypothetical protein IH903_09075 [Proteobacteria bacterium]|nr:hypothetical protein [Pseudomonadota bacterium]